MNHDFEAMREAMVESQLRPNAVDDSRILKAMASVPREKFVPESRQMLAYAETMVPVANGRTLNLPMATGLLLTRLSLRADDRLLIVGAATGYSAAVCSRIVASVVALESDRALLGHARDALAGIDNIGLVEGPLTEGWSAHRPYDAILIDGAVAHLPETIVGQLADGGRLAAALMDDGIARLVTGRKHGEAFGTVAFGDTDSTLLPGFQKRKIFVF